MNSPIDYSHLISLALVLAASTLSTWFATWNANAKKYRGRLQVPYHWDIWKVLHLVAQLLFAYPFFFIPAWIVTAILRAIFSPPTESPDTVYFYAVLQSSVQLATLFWVGVSFAHLAIPHGRTSFWKHMRQYLVAIAPAYLVTVGLASLGAQALALMIHQRQFQIAKAWWLFRLPIFSPRPTLNLLLVLSLVIINGSVSYLQRKRGERLGEAEPDQTEVAVSLVAIGFGLLLLTASIPLADGIITMRWPITTGTILDSKLEDGPPGSIYVHLSYQYSVDDKTYIGRHIHDFEIYSQAARSYSKGAEDYIRTEYAAHNQVKVYYNPPHPEIACLEPGPHVFELLCFCIGLFFFVGGCYARY